MSVNYVKITFDILVTWIFAAGLNPPLKNENRAKLKGMLERNSSAYQYVHLYLAAPVLLSTIAGTCLILIREERFSFVGKISSQFFLFNSGDATNIRMSTLNAIGGLMMIAGGLMRLWTYRALGKFFTYQFGIQKDQKLVQTGLYAIVRHPAYTAILFTHPGTALWTLSAGSWVGESGILRTWPGDIFFTIYTLFLLSGLLVSFQRIPQEDEVLNKHFGKQWDNSTISEYRPIRNRKYRKIEWQYMRHHALRYQRNQCWRRGVLWGQSQRKTIYRKLSRKSCVRP